MIPEQLKGEGTAAYEAFKAYCKAGPKRSIRKVARQCIKSESLLLRWSMRHGWVNRTKAFDEAQTKIESEAAKKLTEKRAVNWTEAKEALHRDELELGEQMMAAAREALKHVNLKDCSASDVVRLSEYGSKLRRLASGEQTEVLKVETQDMDLSRLSVDELRTLRDLQNKATGTSPD